MAQVQRLLSGSPTIAHYAVGSATVIEAGDFVAISSGNLIPVSDIADAGDAAANREAGADACIGIALAGSASGSTARVAVGLGVPGAIWRCVQETAAACNVGDNVGLFADADECKAQLVVEDDTSFIGKLVTEKGATGTDVDIVLNCSIWMVAQG
jgi:hypothetical protein